jgi:hypothetical protein
LLILRTTAHLVARLALLVAGNVLEQLLDQVDMGEDHATAAVALELEVVDGVAVVRRWLAGVVLAKRNVNALRIALAAVDIREILLPEVTDDLVLLV